MQKISLWSLDRFEEKNAVLVSHETREERIVNNISPSREGGVFIEKDGEFLYSSSKTEELKNRISAKFARLKTKKRVIK